MSILDISQDLVFWKKWYCLSDIYQSLATFEFIKVSIIDFLGFVRKLMFLKYNCQKTLKRNCQKTLKKKTQKHHLSRENQILIKSKHISHTLCSHNVFTKTVCTCITYFVNVCKDDFY